MSSKPTQITDEVYQYLLEHNPIGHPVLNQLARITATRSDAMMQISPEQGAFMKIFTQIHSPKRALEIGCFTGYSAIAIALGLPQGGRLITCDVNKEVTDIAQSFFREAGVADKIELRLGPGLTTTATLLAQYGPGSFDQVFIDADKENYSNYYEAALELLRPGGVILVDNVLWSGRITLKQPDSPSTAAIQEFNTRILSDKRVDAAMLPIADGLYLIRKH